MGNILILSCPHFFLIAENPLYWQISGVSFDSFLQAPNSEAEQNVVYRFGSVGQVIILKFKVQNKFFVIAP